MPLEVGRGSATSNDFVTSTAQHPIDHSAISDEDDDSSDDVELSSEPSDITSSSGVSTSEDPDDDHTIEDSEDEAEEENASEQDDDLPQKVRGPKTNTSDLKARLSKLLPELQKANADLTAPGNSSKHRIDAVNEDEDHYIEMDLGLGVLQEVQETDRDHIIVPKDNSSSRSSSDTEDADAIEMISRSKEQPEKPSKRKIEEIS